MTTRTHAPSAEMVLTEEEARALGRKVMGLASAETVNIALVHTVRQITRIAQNHMQTGDEGSELYLSIRTKFGFRGSSIVTNQVDDAVLLAAVRRAEAAARALTGPTWSLQHIPFGMQHYLPVDLWRPKTVEALADRPVTIGAMIATVKNAGLVASGFTGLMARCAYVMNRDGMETYYRETDCECTMMARTPDGMGSGWDGQANRDWTQIDPQTIARKAIDLAQRGAHPVAVEPGRRTAIFSPLAVAQLLHLMTGEYDANATDQGFTPFSKHPSPGNKLGLKVFDERVTFSSDPMDPDGGYRPDFGQGFPQPKMTWVDRGILTNLAYDPYYAMEMGKPYAEEPWSFRMDGGTTTIDEMIAQCAQGVYVNRVSNLELIDSASGMLTGATRDGTFFIKDGKIEKAIKNYRFADSPWFFLNNLVAIGPTGRSAFGYTPPARGSELFDSDHTQWPRRPLIVPSLMVRDFNFTSLADAV